MSAFQFHKGIKTAIIFSLIFDWKAEVMTDYPKIILQHAASHFFSIFVCVNVRHENVFVM
jgi:hypothetical protein